MSSTDSVATAQNGSAQRGSARKGSAQNPADSRRMLAALELSAVEPEYGDSAYAAVTQYVPWPKAYGGDLVAMGVRAMQGSFAPDSDKTLHSMHSYFMRPGDIGAEVRFEVEHLRDGRGFSTRGVRAYQNGKVIYTGLASFSISATGPESSPQPEDILGADIPAPEDVPTAAESLGDPARLPEDLRAAADYWAYGRSVDIRHIHGPVYITPDDTGTPRQGLWLKSFDALADDPALHQAALAYVCDYTILEPSLRALGLHWAAEGMVTASLDHSMWFHRPARVDDWLLYISESFNVSGQRGLSGGKFYTRDGSLVATLAQEGMIRTPSPSPSS